MDIISVRIPLYLLISHINQSSIQGNLYHTINYGGRIVAMITRQSKDSSDRPAMNFLGISSWKY